MTLRRLVRGSLKLDGLKSRVQRGTIFFIIASGGSSLFSYAHAASEQSDK